MYRDHPRMMQGDDYTYWKDIFEMPLVLCCWVGGWLILFPFLVFEILCALIMMRCFFDGIFFGFVIFFRAFARFLGFSSGILSLFLKKSEKIYH